MGLAAECWTQPSAIVTEGVCESMLPALCMALRHSYWRVHLQMHCVLHLAWQVGNGFEPPPCMCIDTMKVNIEQHNCEADKQLSASGLGSRQSCCQVHQES